MEESQDRTSRRLKQKLWRIVGFLYISGPLAPTQAHTLLAGSHTVGFLYISGPHAQGMVWLTVAWTFLLQLMIKTLSQRCTLGQIRYGQSLTETPFSSYCVELTVGDYSNVSQDEQLRKDCKSHRQETRLREINKSHSRTVLRDWFLLR